MKNKTKLLIAGCLALMLGGCEKPPQQVHRYWEVVDGSKTDGTVTLAYQIWWDKTPIISETQGISEAKRICEHWGYNSAASFTSPQSQCMSEYSIIVYNTVHKRCKEWEVTKKYQCRNVKKSKSVVPSNIPLWKDRELPDLSSGDDK